MTDHTAKLHHQNPAEPSLGDVMYSLWSARFYMAAFMAAGFLIALVFIGSAIPQYRASILVAPAERSRGADLKSLMPQTTSFALQKLVNSIAPQDTTDFVRFTHILRGPSVAQKLLGYKQELQPVKTHKRFLFAASADPLDSAGKLSSYLEDQISIHPVGNTALRRIVFDHSDPEFAKAFLLLLYQMTDNMIRDDNRDATDQRITYLKNMLGDVRNPDHRRAITALLMEQEHSKMILQIDEPYAAMLAESASVTHKPIWLNQLFLYGLCLVLSAFTGYAFYGFRQASKTAPQL